jgi:hypothetical protein
MRETSYLGIDFSGNHLRWRRGTRRSNVWIAQVAESGGGLELRDLRCVQDLPGDEIPFERLARHLREGRFRAAAIDAPFSVPLKFLRKRNHAALLKEVAEIARSTPERPFPTANEFVRVIARQVPCNPQKPLRRTEQDWKDMGVNVRSTLWCEPRGGAAMTAACLMLLREAARPIWPWADSNMPGLLVEAFPAAQLRHWRLPHDRYNGATNRERRDHLVSQLRRRLSFTTDHRGVILENGDALDAVICAFAARAVARGAVALPPIASAGDEGWIAVDEEYPGQ